MDGTFLFAVSLLYRKGFIPLNRHAGTADFCNSSGMYPGVFPVDGEAFQSGGGVNIILYIRVLPGFFL
jgi:hypothetical protein